MRVSPDQIVADESRVWEPWVPQTGQRVRVRISAECEFQYPQTDIAHRPEMDGAVGVVGVVGGPPLLGFSACDHSAHDPGHRFSVIFDAPVVLRHSRSMRHTSLGQCFAAIELEPVS